MKIRNRNRRQFVASVEQVESRCLLSVAPYYTVQDLGVTTSLYHPPTSVPVPDLLNPNGQAYERAQNSIGQSTGVAVPPYIQYSTQQWHAYFYSNGVMTDITAKAANAEGRAINDSGQVVGWEVQYSDYPGGWNQAFVTGPNGTGITLLTDGITAQGFSEANSINSEGDVVGIANNYGFIYKNGNMYNLNYQISANQGLHISTGISIDDDGKIIAGGTDINGSAYFLLTPIPQPVAPKITWSNPSDIVYGTPLSSTQLDATASVPGTFTYTLAAGTVLHAGAAQTLSATFTPNDTTDYTTVTTTASINVLQAPLTITANNATKIYGASVPSLAVSYNGFVNGDTVASLTTSTTATTSATSASPVGSYAITPSGAVNPDYAITYVNGTLAITPAPLTVKADNAYSQIGFPIPPLTGTITGLVNGDTDVATYTTTATQSSYLGNYPIVPHLADPNYNITIVNGTLTIGYYPFPWPPF